MRLDKIYDGKLFQVYSIKNPSKEFKESHPFNYIILSIDSDCITLDEDNMIDGNYIGVADGCTYIFTYKTALSKKIISDLNDFSKLVKINDRGSCAMCLDRYFNIKPQQVKNNNTNADSCAKNCAKNNAKNNVNDVKNCANCNNSCAKNCAKQIINTTVKPKLKKSYVVMAVYPRLNKVSPLFNRPIIINATAKKLQFDNLSKQICGIVNDSIKEKSTQIKMTCEEWLNDFIQHPFMTINTTCVSYPKHIDDNSVNKIIKCKNCIKKGRIGK